jgi:hypothetical protein
MMPRDIPLLALTEVRLVRMDSKSVERGVPDLWQVCVEGYMIGPPVLLEYAKDLKAWLEEGALRDITNLFREGT